MNLASNFSSSENLTFQPMLGYFNRTHALLDGSWYYYKHFLLLESFLAFLSIIWAIFWIMIMLTSQSLHRNSRCLQCVYYSQYVFQLFFWFFQPILILMEEVDDFNLNFKQFFGICGAVRIIGISYAFYTLPAMVIERTFATFLVSRYELNSNAYIGNIIIVVQAVVAFTSGILIIRADNYVIYIIIAIISNVIAFLINNINCKLNGKYFRTFDSRLYSLSERFQIVENIKTAEMYNKILYTIGIFNITVNICLISDNYDISTSYKNLSSVLCDYSILIYGLMVPIVTYRATESWQRRMRTLFGSIFPKRTHPLRNTFGQDISSKDSKQETAVYFEMLANQWK